MCEDHPLRQNALWEWGKIISETLSYEFKESEVHDQCSVIITCDSLLFLANDARMSHFPRSLICKFVAFSSRLRPNLVVQTFAHTAFADYPVPASICSSTLAAVSLCMGRMEQKYGCLAVHLLQVQLSYLVDKDGTNLITYKSIVQNGISEWKIS